MTDNDELVKNCEICDNLDCEMFELVCNECLRGFHSEKKKNLCVECESERLIRCKWQYRKKKILETVGSIMDTISDVAIDVEVGR